MTADAQPPAPQTTTDQPDTGAARLAWWRRPWLMAPVAAVLTVVVLGLAIANSSPSPAGPAAPADTGIYPIATGLPADLQLTGADAVDVSGGHAVDATVQRVDGADAGLTITIGHTSDDRSTE